VAPAPVHRDRPLFALALRLASAVVVSLLYALVKYCGRLGIALPEIMFWRQMVVLPLIGGWLALTGRLALLRTRRLLGHAGRATTGMAGMATSFEAAKLLPLPVASVLGFTAPLFAVMLAALLLRERVGPWRWLSVGLGFAGVVFIVHPGGAAFHFASLGTAVGLVSGALVAVISLQIRELTRTEAMPAIVFYFALFGTLLMTPFQPFVMHGHTAPQLLALAALGVTGTLGQMLLTGALRYGRIASVVVMDYTALIWMTLLGWGVFGQLPPPTLWFGAPLVIAAGLVITWRETRAEARAFSDQIGSKNALDSLVGRIFRIAQ